MFRTEPGARPIWRPIAALALVFALVVPLLGWSNAAAQATLPETAAAAPASTVLFQSLDLDLEGEQWQQTEALLARVGMPDAIEMWREETLAEGAGEQDFSESDLDALLGGEVAFVVTPPAIEWYMGMMRAGHGHDGDYAAKADTATESDIATPVAGMLSEETGYGFAVVLRAGDPAAAWDYAERQITEYAQERGVELEVASGPGSDLIWSETAPVQHDASRDRDHMEEMFGRHSKDTFAVGHAGDFLIAAKRPADVTAIMDVIDGTTPSLADSEAAQGVMAQLPSDALAYTYIDGQTIVETLGPEILESLKSFVPADMPEEAWGGYAAMAISAEPVGFRLDSFNRFAEGVDTTSLIVPNDPAVAAMAEQAPEGTFIFQAGNLPPNALAGAPFALAQAVNGAMAEQEWDDEAMDAMEMLPTPEEVEEQIAMATERLGFNPASDLFDLIGGEFIAFSSFPSFGMSGFGVDAVAAISTTDAASLAETARKAAAWVDRAEPHVDVSVRRDGADTIYVISDPNNPETPSLEFGVVHDQAVVAIGDGIAALQSDPAASLAQDGQFQDVMALLPSEFSQVAYVDIGQAMGLIAMFTGGMDSTSIEDADLACASYDDQAAAQAALDEDPVANADLDLDYDGTACEDAFATGGAAGSNIGSPENVRALAVVNFERDGGAGTSAILYIAEPGA